MTTLRDLTGTGFAADKIATAIVAWRDQIMAAGEMARQLKRADAVLGVSLPGHWRHRQADGTAEQMLIHAEWYRMAAYDEDPMSEGGTVLRGTDSRAVVVRDLLVPLDATAEQITEL